MVGEAFRAIENVSASLEFKMHAIKKCLLKMLFFFGPSLGPPAFASGPRLGPQKSIFSAHFSMAGILILETQTIYLMHYFFSRPQQHKHHFYNDLSTRFWTHGQMKVYYLVHTQYMHFRDTEFTKQDRRK